MKEKFVKKKLRRLGYKFYYHDKHSCVDVYVKFLFNKKMEIFITDKWNVSGWVVVNRDHSNIEYTSWHRFVHNKLFKDVKKIREAGELGEKRNLCI